MSRAPERRRHRWSAASIGSLVLGGALASIITGCSDEPFADDRRGPRWGSDDSLTLPNLREAALAVEVSAPTRTTVQLALLGPERSGVPENVDAFRISDADGALDVLSATYDKETGIITLDTAVQKLGARYRLVVEAPGSALHDVEARFIAADTTTFWASDFGDPNVVDYQVKAVRVGVGQHVVLYAEEKFEPLDVDKTLTAFDEQIFPIETELFGEAPDRDDNGKIILLALDGAIHYAGYFNAIDTLTDAEAMETYGLHSNEGEILYLNVSVLDGFDPEVTVPHEFLHLLHQEQHGMDAPYFGYHDEGLAECAVHAVNGYHPEAAGYYAADPTGQLATGLSLVHWTYGNYSQYVQAYLFWTYAAAQLGGVEHYGELFRQPGSPASIGELFTEKLGADFNTILRRTLVAAWVQAPTGTHGFNGFLDLPNHPPTVPPGLSSVDLPPFAAAFFPLAVDQVHEPAPRGENVEYVGIAANGLVDAVPPYNVAGGVLLAMNTRFDWEDPTPEPSGPGMPALSFLGTPPASGALYLGTAADSASLQVDQPSRDKAWRHPPPLRPWDREPFEKWRAATGLRAGPR